MSIEKNDTATQKMMEDIYKHCSANQHFVDESLVFPRRGRTEAVGVVVATILASLPDASVSIYSMGRRQAITQLELIKKALEEEKKNRK